MRLWVSFLVFLIAAPVVAEEVSCGPDGPWHDPAMDYHLDDLLALIEARLDWEEGKPREDDPGDAERVAAAVAAWQRLAEPHDGRSGNPEARWWLGHLMMEGKAGFEADAWGALAFLLPAAEAGHLEAMTQAGRILVRDENAEKLTPDASALPAPAKGRACLKRAAWLGNREAQVFLDYLRNGPDGPTALLAAAGLDMSGPESHNLAVQLLNNKNNFDLAERIFARCSMCGSAICQLSYGLFLSKFRRTEVGDEEISFWISLAARGGSQRAAQMVDRHEPLIKDRDWMNLVKRVHNWKPLECR